MFSLITFQDITDLRSSDGRLQDTDLRTNNFGLTYQTGSMITDAFNYTFENLSPVQPISQSTSGCTARSSPTADILAALADDVSVTVNPSSMEATPQSAAAATVSALDATPGTPLPSDGAMTITSPSPSVLVKIKTPLGFKYNLPGFCSFSGRTLLINMDLCPLKDRQLDREFQWFISYPPGVTNSIRVITFPQYILAIIADHPDFIEQRAHDFLTMHLTN